LEYDYNSYCYNDSTGQHFISSSLDYSVIVLERRMLIPIANYSQLTVSAEFEGLSGFTGIFFEAYADESRAFQEVDILPGNITTVNVTAPLDNARIENDGWLADVVFRLQIDLTEGGHVKLRGITIDARFTGTLSRVQLDIKSTENRSLYENPYMKFARYSPRIVLVQNNYSSSARFHFPCRENDVIYLPPGTYEGVVYWNTNNQEAPDPTNSSLWTPNLSFNVTEDVAYKVDTALFARRIDLTISPSVFLHGLSLFFLGDYQYSGFSDIVGSTVYSQVPDYLYIPGEVESLSISITTWSSMQLGLERGWRQNEYFHIDKDITFSLNNNSMNLQLSVSFPYIVIGGALFGLGEFIVLAVIVLLVIGFIISMRRALRYSDLRNRLSDSRLLPLLMLSMSIFLPWSTQFAKYANPGFEGISTISWFSVPFMIRWSDKTALQLLLSTQDWWYVTWIFTLFFFLPLSYAYLSLSSPETEEFNRTFALVLLLPYLAVLFGFNFSVINLETISLGPIVALAALPVWLLRLGLRKLKITT